jgi:hypothetical protein
MTVTDHEFEPYPAPITWPTCCYVYRVGKTGRPCDQPTDEHIQVPSETDASASTSSEAGA